MSKCIQKAALGAESLSIRIISLCLNGQESGKEVIVKCALKSTKQQEHLSIVMYTEWKCEGALLPQGGGNASQVIGIAYPADQVT